MTTFTQTLTFVTVPCSRCGIEFGLPTTFRDRRLEDGQTFYCPNGHILSWHETDLDRLKKQLAATKRNEEWYRQNYEARGKCLEHERARVRGYQGVITKTKKRIAHGVCPCCNRTFQDLARHMTTKHPGYAKKDEQP